ncbi:helix-turn-helix domain-containing protein [Actinosynnema sp. CA-248983]
MARKVTKDLAVRCVVEYLFSGKTIRDLMRETGLPYGTVRNTLVNSGVRLRSRGAKSADRVMRKMPISDMERARRQELGQLLLSLRLAAGFTGYQVSMFGYLSQPDVSRLEHGQKASVVDVIRLSVDYGVGADVSYRIVALALMIGRDSEGRWR